MSAKKLTCSKCNSIKEPGLPCKPCEAQYQRHYEYRCDGEWVTASWREYETQTPLDWPDDPEYMPNPEVVDVILTASDEARLELTRQIYQSLEVFYKRAILRS